MVEDLIYKQLSDLRNEYRVKMNISADAAQVAAQTEEMDKVSLYSTESERYREAFHALNRAIQIVDGQ